MGAVLRLFVMVALFAVLAAGCGGAARTRSTARHGVPRALAQRWEARASAIAAAASAGDDCGALRLASSLRDQVVAMQRKLPMRLRSPLISGVNALADRLTCTPPPHVATKPRKPPEPPKPPHDHGHGHHGHHGGDGNGQ